jgi:hypothetical protein
MSVTTSEVLAGADLSDAELVALARELAAMPEDRGPGFFGTPRDRHPIRGSGQDQDMPAGIANPYWEIVREMPGESDFLGRGFEINGFWSRLDSSTLERAYATGLERQSLCVRYTWSIPSPGDIAWIRNNLNGQGVVEIGAGAGYWAWQLQQAGVDVVAYDPNPVGQNTFAAHRAYTDVRIGDDSAAAEHPDRALMLCWPSYCDPFAKQALHAYQGDTVIYIGEGEGGCCADDRFHRILRRDFDDAGFSPWHINFYGIHCSLTMWRRKED